ncbi:hypothetical protein ACJRO7_009416 [Eucalyptus globulus]|uniref:Uncharacterized protein n=1 Tax=Eucalyptus globulus TaxID=34317 RepID=A0ABD3LEB2_EUCGL
MIGCMFTSPGFVASKRDWNEHAGEERSAHARARRGASRLNPGGTMVDSRAESAGVICQGRGHLKRVSLLPSRQRRCPSASRGPSFLGTPTPYGASEGQTGAVVSVGRCLVQKGSISYCRRFIQLEMRSTRPCRIYPSLSETNVVRKFTRNHESTRPMRCARSRLN